MKRKVPWSIFILILALILRVIFWRNYGVGFDQVQILNQARAIIEGNLSLIGPRTGPARMFTGPLIYYLSAVVVWLFNEAVAVIVVPVLLSLVTGLVLFWLSRRYLGQLQANLMLLLWALSPFIVSLDRTFWNPNLTLLAASLCLIPLLGEDEDQLSGWFVLLGTFFSYQAHFSGLLLLGLVLLAVVWLKKSWKYLLFGAIGLGVSLVPTIVFDLRNDFLNWHGLLEFLLNGDGLDLQIIIREWLHNLYISLETWGKLFLFGNSTVTILVLGLFLLGLTIYYLREQRKVWLNMSWLLLVSTLFAFYRGSKPEYYFLIIVPSLIYLSSLLLIKLKKRFLLSVIILFVLNAVAMGVVIARTRTGITVGEIQQIKAYLSKLPVKSLVYDLAYGSESGLQYFLEDLEKDTEGQVVHIGPAGGVNYSRVKEFGDLAVWVDPRQAGYHYVTTNDYFLQVPERYLLLEDHSPRQTLDSYDVYHLSDEGQLMGVLSVAHESQTKLDWVQLCLENGVNKQAWIESQADTLINFSGEHCLRLWVEEQPQAIDSIKLVNLIE